MCNCTDLMQSLAHLIDPLQVQQGLLDLSHLGCQAELATQCELIQHDEMGVRMNTAIVMGTQRIGEALPTLYEQFMRDEDEQVRYVIALALLRYNTQATHDFLSRCAQHEREDIRRAAHSALRALPYQLT
ncbi:MAG: HEAT repeat domain-containing protein [Phototrophicaceae bacterium]